ncbi:DNA translocase FtsK [Bacillus atrophaeus]|uniref:DNA translocase FtsK n=1 Tax=Bacillus atrophaeus TaxID=1452 RepID=UPI002E23ECA1|nr:DNA translocase FtsK [Bacillus atrophaeus]MED4815623.1 DNA translocase FtsK [Bacillus atrophaeus]MED4822448.1 DNA translocase FtsK [Bacillus atrophaeus]MED4845091.1 DNA translocase FtsK [Bacillus atrophaeus]
MSWLNKFFDLFLGENEEENDERETKPAQVQNQQERHHPEGQLKRLEDPKIYYEYPKGKFRFPVVPDGQWRTEQRRRETYERSNASSAAQSRPVQEKEQIDRTKHTYEKSETAKKPFKPTSIPSPVYGFNGKHRIKTDVPKPPAKKTDKQAPPKAVKEKVTLLSEEAEKQRENPFLEKQPVQKKEESQTPEKQAPKASEETVSTHAEPMKNLFQQNDGTETKAQVKTSIQNEESILHAQNEAPLASQADQADERKQEEFGPNIENDKLNLHVQEEPEVSSASQTDRQDELQQENPEPNIEAEEFNTHVQEEPDEMIASQADEPRQKKAGPTLDEEFVPKAREESPMSVPQAEQAEAHLNEEPGLDAEKEELTPQVQEEASVPSSQEDKIERQPDFTDQHTEEELVSRQTEDLSEFRTQDEQENAEPITEQERKEESAENISEPAMQTAQMQKKDNHTTEVHGRNDPADSRKEKGQAKQTEHSQKGSSVPFNVLMLKSDTHKQQKMAGSRAGYVFPNVSLLDVPPAQRQDDHTWIEDQRKLLDLTLKNFNVRANVVHVTQGPSVTRFEVHPEPGVKVNKITNLSDDIKLSLSAKDIRIEAPIPGKNTIGIEVPNRTSKVVDLRQMIRSAAFRTNASPLTAALGLDISGNPVVIDLKKMPHGLIAGATGSGKSVCINTILVSLLYKADPSDVKVLLIDPKMVELAPYNKIPHLVSPVITDAKAATAALKWVVEEMERRYELFAHSGVRDIDRFNQLTSEHQTGEKLPYLVVVIDELADLMMVAPNDVEESIARIAQKARACGIHLLVATQRPSVDVITGLIKANIPTRIAFSVSSQVDSRTIIDMAGAEKLLGKGDMLFLENGSGKPVRLQGNFVSDREIDRVVAHVRDQLPPSYLFEQEELIRQGTALKEEDELFFEACEFVVEQNSASTSSLQRRFRIGYNRAARLIDMMEAEGMISEAKGSKPREVLITAAELTNE